MIIKRYADEVTLDHIIELRAEVRRLESLSNALQLKADNLTKTVTYLCRENHELTQQLKGK
jgi:hypothetical protein